MDKSHNIFEKTIFKNSSLSTREAYVWLQNNSLNGQVHISLRNLAQIWKWHYSAVKRFLDKLKVELLIEVSISSKIMVINLPKTTNETILVQYRNNEKLAHTDSEAITSTITQQSKQQYSTQSTLDKIDRNNSCNNVSQSCQGLDADVRTIFGQQADLNLSQEEEKKKGTQKRKEEEFVKERNIPYGDTKKENGNDFSKNYSGFSEKDTASNQHLITQSASEVGCNKLSTLVFSSSAESSAVDGSKAPRIIPFELVQVSDVEGWAIDALKDSMNIINLITELDKFKNFWRSTHKKPPKDGISAFKNWLHRAIEFKQQNQQFKENKNDGRSSYKSNRQIGFERFLAAGAKVIARYEGC